MIVRFSIPGRARPKGRPRVRVVGRFAQAYTPAETRSAEATARQIAALAMAGRKPIERPVKVWIDAVMLVPTSWSKRKRDAALRGEIFPSGRPDLDNIEKLVMDAMNTVVLRDDALVVWKRGTKRYGEVAQTNVVVEEIGGEGSDE